MESLLVRYRNPLVLLALLVAQMIGLAMQVHRTDAGRNTLDSQDGKGVRLIRLWANALVSPPELFMHASKLGAGGLWGNYIALQHVREENQDLERTIDRLRLEQASLMEDARQGQRLQDLMHFQEKYIYKTTPAQVIGSSGSDQSRVFYIDKGADYHLERDMAVITADGIVGKIREVFPHTAQVLPINDQTSGAGVILETTRIRGILRGNAAGQPQVVGILADQRIQPGEKVLTAGGDQVFPRGLSVGVVEKIVRDPDRDGFIDILVKPAAHIDRLDEVLVITDIESHFSPQQQQDLTTSEADKGADAAAIKEQQKASQIMAERLPGLTDPLPAKQAAAAGQPGAAGTPGTAGAPGANTQPTPAPAENAHPAAALHPDRFSPGSTTAPAASSTPKPDTTSKPRLPKTPAAPANGPSKPISKPAPKSGPVNEPRRNP